MRAYLHQLRLVGQSGGYARPTFPQTLGRHLDNKYALAVIVVVFAFAGAALRTVNYVSTPQRSPPLS